jgi:nucleotide-binding universal stress UspA family protein
MDGLEGCLNGAPCAIAVAPSGYADGAGNLAVLGVGYDGSAESEVALATARKLAARWKSRIRAQSVVAIQTIAHGEPVGPNWPDAVKRLMEDERRRQSGLEEVEADVTYGHPGEELVAFGQHVDIMVVGSRGYGPVGRLVHGSTSNQLARRMPCPLLVLPRSLSQSARGDWGLPLEVEWRDQERVESTTRRPS